MEGAGLEPAAFAMPVLPPFDHGRERDRTSDLSDVNGTLYH